MSAGDGAAGPVGAAFVVVAIPTYRRPEQLAHLLASLAAPGEAAVGLILIADNDGDRQEGLACAQATAAAGYPIPIEAFVVAEKGLCSVRNALIARALDVPGMTHLAMIDDDEWPQPGWLAALLRQQAASGADAVAGPVDAQFVGRRPRWAGQTLVFRPEQRAAGRADMLWGSNNVLVTRACLASTAPPWFDPAFNATGGEDVDLFTRWRGEGRVLAWEPDARVSEWVPPARARIGWVMRRMWRMGGTEVLVARKHRPGPGARAVLALCCAAIVAARTAALPLALLPGANRVDHAGQWVKALGRIAALTGHGYREYR